VFRSVDLDSKGALEVHLDGNRVSPPPEGTLRWIDLSGENAGLLDELRQRFDFHPLAIEDCREFDQRPKLEEYRDHLFLVTQGFSSQGELVSELTLHELHAFLGKNYLVTVHTDELLSVEDVWRRVTHSPAALERGVDFVYYLIASRMADADFPILDRITDELEGIEDRILAAPSPSDLSRIFELKRHLVMMRKVLSPQRDTMAMLSRRGDSRVSERTSHYFRDVHDQLVRINESIEANRDLLGNALEAYLSSAANRTNEIMKYLTLLSAVFLPLAFIVGFFGQNFVNLPGLPGWVESDALMRVMVALCIVTPIGMVTWFKLRRWI
jgi:magnesium transporter